MPPAVYERKDLSDPNPNTDPAVLNNSAAIFDFGNPNTDFAAAPQVQMYLTVRVSNNSPVPRFAITTTGVNGEQRKVVANFSRNGYYYTLDRNNGQFLRADQYQEKVTWTKRIDPKTGRPLDYNPQGYRWGNLHEFNGWAGYTWMPGLTTTFRVCGTTQGHIDGFDPLINGPAVPANPLFYGGQRVELFGGGSISGKLIGIENALILVEAGAPVYQNLNGPQIKKNWQAAARLAFKF